MEHNNLVLIFTEMELLGIFSAVAECKFLKIYNAIVPEYYQKQNPDMPCRSMGTGSCSLSLAKVLSIVQV